MVRGTFQLKSVIEIMNQSVLNWTTDHLLIQCCRAEHPYTGFLLLPFCGIKLLESPAEHTELLCKDQVELDHHSYPSHLVPVL